MNFEKQKPMNNEQSIKMGGVKKASDSELNKLLSSLSKEISISNELRLQFVRLVNALKPDYSILPEDDIMEDMSPEGIIGSFWEQVRSLEYGNSKMTETVEHLRSIVGDY